MTLTGPYGESALALANQVQRYIQRTAKDASPSAVRAAIMRVMQEIEG